MKNENQSIKKTVWQSIPAMFILMIGANAFQSCSNSNAQEDGHLSCNPGSSISLADHGSEQQLSVEEMIDLLPTEFKNLTDDQKSISLSIYHLMKSGNPVRFADLAAYTDIDQNEVEATVKNWPGVFIDDQNQIIGYWGLSVKNFGHKIIVGKQPLYAWCAWDALFLPQVLGEETKVITEDANSGEKLELVIDKNGNLLSYPEGMTMSLLLPDSEKTNEEICKDVVSNFCHFILFFKDEASGQDFVSKNPQTVLLSMEKAIELSKYKNKLQYGDLLNKL